MARENRPKCVPKETCRATGDISLVSVRDVYAEKILRHCSLNCHEHNMGTKD